MEQLKKLEAGEQLENLETSEAREVGHAELNAAADEAHGAATGK